MWSTRGTVRTETTPRRSWTLRNAEAHYCTTCTRPPCSSHKQCEQCTVLSIPRHHRSSAAIYPPAHLHKYTQTIRTLYRSSQKSTGSPYSITERGVLELIPVLGSQPAGDVSHKPNGTLPLLSARPAVYNSQPLRGLLPISLLGEQRHDGCEQFA